MAATKEMTVEDKLKALYHLQAIDSKINEINILKGELPIEVSDLEDEIAGLETRIGNADDEIKALEDKISDYDNARKEAQKLIEKYDKQQMNVKNNREYEALTKEIELQNLEIQLMEKKSRDARVQIEKKNELLDAAKEIIEEKHKVLETKKVELEKINKETDKELKALSKEFETQSSEIEDRLNKAYHRIRKSYKNGLAVVKIERDSCGGCFAKVPAQRQVEIKQRKKIIVCEHCGRIMVDPEIDGEAAE